MTPLDSAIEPARGSTTVPVPAPSWAAEIGTGVFAGLVSVLWSWHPSLWTDEAATISAARRSPSQLWHMVHNIDAVHGLYYFGMHVWTSVFGTSALAVRLPSAIAVGLTAALLVVLAGRLGAQPALAITIGLVFALLPRTTWMGTEARSYAGTALLAVLLTLLATAARSRDAWWIGYAALAAVAVVFNLYLGLLLLAHGVSLLGQRVPRRTLTGFAAAVVAGIAAASPAILIAKSQSGQIGSAHLSVVQLVRNLLVNQAFLGDTPSTSNASSTSLSVSNASDLWQPASVLLAVIAVVVMIAGSFYLRPGGEQRELVVWAAPWAILPGVLVAASTLAGSSLYSPRYFSFGTPAVAVLIGLGLATLRRLSPIGATTTGLAMVVLAVPVYVSQRQVNAKAGTDWSQVAAVVGAHKATGQGVYFAPRYPEVPGTTVGRTLRSIEDAYPSDFTGLYDITRLASPVQTNDLVGTSARLTAASPRLKRVDAVWVIRRNDYPADLTAQETQFLDQKGFAASYIWKGDLTSVTEFVRSRSSM